MSTNEYIRKKWGDRPQIELAKEIAKRIARKNGKECGEKDYVAYKGYVNKWFKTDQEPGKDYLLLLAEILNVSVESILRGEDMVTEYGERPTAYAAAKSGDERIIERLFGNAEADIGLDERDEYAKSFVHYIIEFNNYQAFRTALSKGYNYPTKWGCLELKPSNNEVDLALTKMVVENDDLETFKKAFGRLYHNTESIHEVYLKHDIPPQITALILKSHKILDWVTQIRPFTKEEFTEIHCGTLNPDDNRIWETPTMVYGYSLLIDRAIKEGLEAPLNLLLDRGLEYVKQLKSFLGERCSEFKKVPYYPYRDDHTEVMLSLKGDRREHCWAIVPYIHNLSDIQNVELRRKAEDINSFFNTL